MPIFSLNGCSVLFIHVPKNGGTSVAEMLEACAEKRFDGRIDVHGRNFRPRHLHATALEEVFFPQMIDYAFMVVRNPVHRIISEYRYQKRRGGLRWQRMTGFDAWLRLSLALTRRHPGYRENHFRPQTEFFGFDCEVFRMEDGMDILRDRLVAVTGASGIPAIGTRNQSPKAPVHLSRHHLRLLFQHYSEDFERFGYAAKAEAYTNLLDGVG